MENQVLDLEQIRRLPHVCRNYDPRGSVRDNQGDCVDPESCIVCGFGVEAHQLSATLQAYEELAEELEEAPKWGDRRNLPKERQSVTKKFKVQWPDENGRTEWLELYLIVGLYEDGTPGELFFACSKVGSFPHGLLAALAIASSRALQHGCPFNEIIKKWRGTQFPPCGFTHDPEFPRCGSLLDYLGQYLESRFVGERNVLT